MKNKVLALLLAAMMSVSLLGSTTLAAELLPAPGASANSGEVTPAVPPEEEERTRKRRNRIPTRRRKSFPPFTWPTKPPFTPARKSSWRKRKP